LPVDQNDYLLSVGRAVHIKPIRFDTQKFAVYDERVTVNYSFGYSSSYGKLLR